jgi:nickel-dependent lactate racemase
MIHDPADEDQCNYLATTASGERIYLAREVVEADFVICIGAVRYDSLLGYRGTQSALYPGLSNVDAIRRAIGGAHVELGPDDPRPLRELADEVGWLLGMQFVVQVVPAGTGGVAAVFAGLSDAVFRTAVESLAAGWRLEFDRRPELVVAAVEAEGGRHTWGQVAQALDVAQRVVARDGRVLLLTQLDQPLSPGLELLRDARTPHEAHRPILDAAREDRDTAWRLAHGVDRANVYLLSRLVPDLVEELFMVPLADEAEALRVLETGDDVVVLGGAQHAFVREAGVTA